MTVSVSTFTGRLVDFFRVIANKEGINGKIILSFNKASMTNRTKLKERIVPNNMNTQCTPRLLFLTRIVMWITLKITINGRGHEGKCAANDALKAHNFRLWNDNITST